MRVAGVLWQSQQQTNIDKINTGRGVRAVSPLVGPAYAALRAHAHAHLMQVAARRFGITEFLFYPPSPRSPHLQASSPQPSKFNTAH